MSVRHVADVEAKPVAAGVHTTIQVLIPSSEGPHFAMRRFVIERGGSMPLHANTVEHEQYVLRGEAHVRIGDEEREVAAGDILFVPADVPHAYTNTGVEPYEFLCVVPNLPDELHVLEEASEA
jgi:quercetin dioxygenase-like cupin family protein